MKPIINWTPKKKDAVCKEIEKWMIKHDAFFGESIMQDDNCLIEAPQLIANLVDKIIKPKVKNDED